MKSNDGNVAAARSVLAIIAAQKSKAAAASCSGAGSGSGSGSGSAAVERKGAAAAEPMPRDALAAHLLELADRYQVPSLAQLCVSVLSTSLTTDNLAELLILADRCHNDVLKVRALLVTFCLVVGYSCILLCTGPVLGLRFEREQAAGGCAGN